jgi:DNA-directed RNA polymerase subunit K
MATKKATKKVTKKATKKTGKKAKNFTRFERARIIGARALQISMGAKPMVDVTPDLDPIDIATMELKENVLPLDVRPLEADEKAL